MHEGASVLIWVQYGQYNSGAKGAVWLPLQARSLSADYGMPGMYGYDAQLEMGGLARGSFEGLNPRNLLYPEAFAHTNFQDMSGAAFLGV